MASVFISYRRADSAGHAGRLSDRLAAEFGSDSVFIDVERLRAGSDFAKEIDETLRKCEVALVVIGPRWLKVADQFGRRRLDQATDFVRREVSAVLTRNIPVIPVLVDGATMPDRDGLPGDLIRLPELQGFALDHYEFHSDVSRLIEDILARVEQRRGELRIVEHREPGIVRAHPTDGLEYVWVPPGDFTMGRVPGDPTDAGKYDDELPPHPVRLTSGFWLSRGPITVDAYRRFCETRKLEVPRAPKYNPNWAHWNHPVVNVAWAQAREYCAWVGGRLPTEAQWEYAARGGLKDALYPWGNEITREHANYSGNPDWNGTSPVAEFEPNGFNLCDMAGNVWEWVADWYDEDLYIARPRHEPTLDPQVYENKVNKRVVRGGSWDSIPIEVRSSNRGFQTPHDGFWDFGFRCLVDEVPE